ncbi:MAG: PSD1 and planctomycete cytochrome C domain-containing protein [Planctomycetota bacterium]|nr:PSD1 and planctomycete cytochrome C domain-containing protein [Planctomycetota bacterium]
MNSRFIPACLLVLFSFSCSRADEPDFNREILPLLSENCFACHGPDENVREAGLRLDLEESALEKLESGNRAIVAGQSSRSELITRIFSEDEDLLMPPPDSGKNLSPAEKEKIRKWVDQGAAWSRHWAFVPPNKPEIPPARKGWQTHSPIDLLIQAELRKQNLSPEKEASRESLIRRVTLDLIGLPPTVQEIDHFLDDPSPNAYEKVVDRLLASRKYGEHMGRIWLDAARYADTHGLHLDNEREIWPYRNWVIDALNSNMPFDQFTIEQLAGDLLPEPTLEQKVATGFNRCNVTTSEGGSIDAEYYVRYAVDRVETTSTVWLGLTSGCAACHDHKFDPLTQKEFYQLFSYFYSLTERAMDGNAKLPPPVIKVATEEQKKELEKLNAELASIAKSLNEKQTALVANYSDPTPDGKLGKLEQAEKVWFDDALPEGARPEGNEGGNSWQFVSAPEHPVYSGKKSTRRSGNGLTQHFFSSVKNKLALGKGDRLFAYVYLDPKNPPETVQLQFNNGTWEHRAFWGADKGHGAGRNNASNLKIGPLPETGKWVRLEVEASRVGLPEGSQVNGWAFTQFGGTVYWDRPGRITTQGLNPEQQKSLAVWEQYRKQVKQPPLPAPIQKILDTESGKRNKDQVKQLVDHFVRNVHPEAVAAIKPFRDQQAAVRTRVDAVNKAIPSSLIMEDRKQKRQAYVLERGEYTQQREKVDSRIPEWISPPVSGMTENRLGLAKWLVSRNHPLTSRVTVNRYWQHFFGTGIVKTSEDFGIQGERPTHPELLDWLAIDFMEHDWNVKRMHKQLVMSATYRQSSHVTPEKLRLDPENRLLSRGPRFRLDAEVIRDSALWVGGLMVEKIGGPSVKPYQPAGLWKPVGFGGSNTAVFRQDKGEKLYRRSMYTFWKRTSPPPSLSTFDAPDRETCQVRRARTNTPLQALVLMNDVQFVEAARKFGERILKEGGESAKSKIEFAFRSVLTRRPSPTELQTLANVHAEAKDEFRNNPHSAAELLKIGESPTADGLDANDLAAWTLVAHVILNLSETVTKN